jgi:uncharacterized delta-60 repeat protein
MAGLDLTFDGDGRTITDLGGDDYINQLLSVGNGKILAVASKGDSTKPGNREIILVRYNSDGSLDSSFGTGGKSNTGLSFLSNQLVTDDGKIIILGSTADGQTSVFRYLVNGQLDTSFATGGKYSPSNVSDGFRELFIRKNPSNNTDEIIINGQRGGLNVDSTTNPPTIRSSSITLILDANGQVKPFPINNNTTAAPIVLDNNVLNQIISSATVNSSDSAVQNVINILGQVAIDRLRSQYAVASYSIISLGTKAESDGSILLALNGILGTNPNQPPSYFSYLTHFGSDGNFDTNFGTNGLATFPSIPNSTRFSGSNFDKTDRAYIAFYNDNTDDMSVLRFDKGTLDSTFGSNGKLILPDKIGLSDTAPFYNYIVISVLIDSQNRAIVGTRRYNESLINCYRINNNGTIDTTFGTNGKFQLEIPAGYVGSSNIILGADDRLFLGGAVNGDILVAKYDVGGTNDLTGGAGLPGALTFDRAFYSINEDGTKNISVTVNRTGGSDGDVSATIILGSGTAKAGEDYNSSPITVSFADKETSKTIEIPIVNDTVYEPSETFSLKLVNPTNGAIVDRQTIATITILDDDAVVVDNLPVISIEIADADAAEPNNPGQFTLTRTGITTADLTVKYSILGTATKGTDYQNLTGTATFSAGSSTATIDLNPIDDNIYEGNETVILTLTDGGTNYKLDTVKSAATLTITDNESIPIIAEGDKPNISLLVTDANAAEELANPGQFTFKRTGETTNALAVNYSLTGTATNDSDYQKLGNTITFAAASNTTTLDINPIDDKRYEGTETVTLTLLDGGTQYKLDPSNSGTVSILDNDPQTPKLTQPLTNILSIEGGSDRSTLKFTKIAQEGAGKNETFAFVVDDDKGRIGGIAPGAAGYLKAALDRSKTIFSNLGNNAVDRKFDLGSQRSLTFAPGDLVEFGSIVGDTIDKVKLDLISGKPTSEVLFSLPSANMGNGDRAKFTTLPNDGGYEIAWSNADSKTNPIYNDLVFKVESINNFTAPVGTNLQGDGEGEVLDLRSFAGKTLQIDTVAVSDAGYNNYIGFYAVADAQGTLANGLKVTDVGYAEAAIKSAVLRSFKNETQSDRQVAGGEILAPVVIANGTFEDFLKNNPQNQANSNIHAYFNYLGANTDKVDHFRLLGDNKFGVEDLYGGGDRDYNDIVFQVNIKV